MFHVSQRRPRPSTNTPIVHSILSKKKHYSNNIYRRLSFKRQWMEIKKGRDQNDWSSTRSSQRTHEHLGGRALAVRLRRPARIQRDLLQRRLLLGCQKVSLVRLFFFGRPKSILAENIDISVKVTYWMYVNQRIKYWRRHAID